MRFTFLNFLAFFLIFLVQVGQAETSLFNLSPSTSMMNGLRYPRNGQTLYRGTQEQQMGLSEALSAMLGDKDIFVESFFFSTIKFKLLGQNFSAAVPLNSYLEDQIQKIRQAKGRSLNLQEAKNTAKELVDRTLDYYLRLNKVIPFYIDYRSSQFNDWPNDVVFTTIISPAAATYGNRVLVFKERTPRAIDLNYWNFKNNGIWYDHTRDAGEFINFGYIEGEDLIGYQIRSGSNKAWHSIRLAIYKAVFESRPYLLVFSGVDQRGRVSTCIDHNSRDDLYYHCDYSAGQVALMPPSLTPERPSLIGVVVLCDSSGENCSRPPKDLLKKYNSSKEKINPADFVIKFNQQSSKWIPADLLP